MKGMDGSERLRVRFDFQGRDVILYDVLISSKQFPTIGQVPKVLAKFDQITLMELAGVAFNISKGCSIALRAASRPGGLRDLHLVGEAGSHVTPVIGRLHVALSLDGQQRLERGYLLERGSVWGQACEIVEMPQSLSRSRSYAVQPVRP